MQGATWHTRNCFANDYMPAWPAARMPTYFHTLSHADAQVVGIVQPICTQLQSRLEARSIEHQFPPKVWLTPSTALARRRSPRLFHVPSLGRQSLLSCALLRSQSSGHNNPSIKEEQLTCYARCPTGDVQVPAPISVKLFLRFVPALAKAIG